jgi:hypothetical protein
MPDKIKRVHALTNTASGVAGEARVGAELARCGIQVAKPYWNDDEIDLLVLHRNGALLYPIPIQVKSVQRDPDDTGNNFIQRLKKRYIEQLPPLCLAIYNPKTDRIWFIDTAERIRSVYRDQGEWHKHKSYDTLGDDEDVRIGLNPTAESTRLDADWLVPRDDASWLSTRIIRATETIREANKLSAVLDKMWTLSDTVGTGEEIELVVEDTEKGTVQKINLADSASGGPQPE